MLAKNILKQIEMMLDIDSKWIEFRHTHSRFWSRFIGLSHRVSSDFIKDADSYIDATSVKQVC